MQEREKEQIARKLREYAGVSGSQNRAAVKIGISPATLSQMLNGKWELITDEMWRQVSAKCGYGLKGEWKVVETRGYRRMTTLLGDAQANSLVYAITGDAGCGKSEAIRQYAQSHRNVCVLSCSEFWTRRYFLQELMTALGIDDSSYAAPDMMNEIVRALKRAENPLIVLDEADKLNDQTLYFFISIHNQLEDRCGIILCATDYLEKRIKQGIRVNKKGYKEISSRFGRRFIPVQAVSADDISDVCIANGMDDAKEIRSIIEDSDNDLRRVKRRIHAWRQKQKGG
jgi:DNA transposition AAA+ family ATPase